MKPQTFPPQQRKKLQQKITETFKTEMKDLRKSFQKILADDLVTAFENRISVIYAFQQKQAKNGAENAKKLSSNPQNIYMKTAEEQEAEV
jgi:mRNA-degrading endonuclease RelE of RelBE toxin-antitoxin system